MESFEGARNCQTQKTIFLFSIYCGNTGYGVSKPGIQNEKVFWLKINMPKGNYWFLGKWPGTSGNWFLGFPVASLILIIFDLEIVNCILLPKLFWPTVRKNCSCDREKLLKFKNITLSNEAEIFLKGYATYFSIWFKALDHEPSTLKKKKVMKKKITYTLYSS